MKNRSFLIGMGTGIAVGSGIGMLVSPRERIKGRTAVGRCLKNLGEMIDDMSDVMG